MKTMIQNIPKAELHLHIEGTLEPDLMLELGRRNDILLPYDSIEEIEAAYDFSDLQSFLDIYYAGMKVLHTERDYFDLTMAYLRKVKAQNVRHVEIFFDPQAHTSRGIPFSRVIGGIDRALKEAGSTMGISSGLILCFLRHLSAADAMKTLELALEYRELLIGVGLDSSESGHPPEKFTEVFARAREHGLKTVAHAGEEGPPAYIRGAIESLKVSRIDHGVRCLEDGALVRMLGAMQIPLTVCPLSNVRLRVFNQMKDHNLKQMLNAGLCVTLNSDDPAYFGGYLVENYRAAQQALDLSRQDIYQLARNSFRASFLGDRDKERLLGELDRFWEEQTD